MDFRIGDRGRVVGSVGTPVLKWTIGSRDAEDEEARGACHGRHRQAFGRAWQPANLVR